MALPYPKMKGMRPRGRSFHHGRLIQNLRKKARESVHTIVEATVTGLVQDPQTERVVGVNYRSSKDGSKGTYRGDFVTFSPLCPHSCRTRSHATQVFCCDGLFSNLRSFFTDDSVTHRSKFVGLLLRNGAASELPFANHGHVFLIDPSPTLIYPVSSTDVRVLGKCSGRASTACGC